MLSNSIFAQQNLGAACGCPAVASRGTAAISSLGTWTNLPAAAYGKELSGNQNITLTCGTIWTLDEKLYIGSGSTITIEPGTVIKGSVAPSVAAARALIIERGGKIMAPGTEDCPIVFTAAADPLNGTYSVNNKGMWGGILICGTATNNLTLAANGPFIPGQGGKLAVADGLGVLEGFASSYPQDQFGVALSVPSGTVQSTSPSGSYSFVLEAGPASSSNAVGSNKINFASTLTAASGAALQNTITFTSVPSHVAVGHPISGTGIPSGSTITAINGSVLTISNNLTAAVSISANAYTVNFVPNYVVQGQTVSGTGIPNGTTILSIASNILTLSANLTSVVAAGDDITFSGTYPNGGVTGYFTTMTYVPPFSGTAPVSGTTGTVASYVGSYYASTGGFNDNDNSGVMTYVSIRHSGANLLVGSEINGLTLASVGRGTKIEHIEIVSCADDNIELFGGTVDLKYCTTLYGNDDMYDYDLGWSGRAQFLFGMKADLASAVGPDNDNGFEADSDDNRSYNTPYSVPKIYNATVIGNAKSATTADNSGMSAIWAKEFAGGEFYNSIFSNFRQGVNFATTTSPTGVAGSSRGTNLGGDAWHNYLPANGAVSATSGNGSERLKIKCNTFVGNSFGLTLGAGTATPTTEVLTTGNVGYDKFVGPDNNIIIAPATGIPGFSSSFAINPTTNVVTTKNDVTPNPALPLGTGCSQAPMDGFFEPANYRGAFSSTAGDNWLSDWSYSQVLGSTLGVQACPTDLNGDGTTDVNDFLIFAPAFGTSCN